MHRILRILWEIACRLRLNQHAPASSDVRIEMTARPWPFLPEIRKILIANNIHPGRAWPKVAEQSNGISMPNYREQNVENHRTIRIKLCSN